MFFVEEFCYALSSLSHKYLFVDAVLKPFPGLLFEEGLEGSL
jgi:hypothetical protein